MKSCLLVDDSRVIRKVARQIFEASGFACEEAENGQIALETCKKNTPDFVLLDWNMPVMNGFDFLLALRREAKDKAPVVVFCSTESDVAHIRQALEAGANEYIMKPFDADIVKGKLEQLGFLQAA